MFRLISKNTNYLRPRVLLSGTNAKYSGKDDIKLPPNSIPVYNESDKIKQQIGTEPKMKSLERLRLAAIRGIRFHEMQIKMHQEELRKHRKNLLKVSEMINARLRKMKTDNSSEKN